MNYIQQFDGFSCAPIAIVNAVLWAGNKTTDPKDLLKMLQVICGTVDPKHFKKNKNNFSAGQGGGTTTEGLQTGVRCMPELELYDALKRPNIKDIKKHVDNNGSVILCYGYPRSRRRGHAIFLDKREGNMYRVVNAPDLTKNDDAVGLIDNITLRSVLRRKFGVVAFLIRHSHGMYS